MNNLQSYIELGKSELSILTKLIDIDSELIPSQINKIDDILSEMVFIFNYTPDWINRYNQILDRYFEPMRVKTKKFTCNPKIFSEN